MAPALLPLSSSCYRDIGSFLHSDRGSGNEMVGSCITKQTLPPSERVTRGNLDDAARYAGG